MAVNWQKAFEEIKDLGIYQSEEEMKTDLEYLRMGSKDEVVTFVKGIRESAKGIHDLNESTTTLREADGNTPGRASQSSLGEFPVSAASGIKAKDAGMRRPVENSYIYREKKRGKE